MENLSEIIMWSLNGAFLLIILLAFLGGVIKGFYKSLTFLGFSIFFFIAGIIAIPFITEWLINFDLSRFNEYLPDEYQITTIKQSLPAILTEQFPDFSSMFVEGSETMALVFGVVRMAINLVLFILLIILNATIFKLFPFIVWLIVKPKKNPLTRKRPGKKRLLGGLIGAVKGFGAVMLLAIPLAGVSSLAESAKSALTEGASPNNHSMALVDDEILDLIDSITSYKKSVFGFALGIPTGDDTRLDEALFDKLLEIRVKTDTSDQRLHIRKDIKKAAAIYAIINEANEYKDEIDPMLVLNITDDQFDEIQKHLKGIVVLNIAKNIGAEFGYDYIVNEGLDEGYEDIVNLQSLKDIDITKELNTLIDIVRILNDEDIKDYITQNGLPETEEQIGELLGMVTKEKVQSVFDKLIELDLLKVGLPVGVNFALGMDEVKDILADIEFEEESIIKPTQEHLLGLIKGVGYLASVVLDANQGSLDFDPSIIFNLTDDYIDELQDIITDMTILDLIKEMGVEYGYKIMVKEGLDEGYDEDVLTLENLQEILLTQELNTILEILRLVNNSELRDEVLENGFPETEEQIEALLSKIDKDLIHEFADILTSLDLVKVGLPIGFNFALRLEALNDALAEFDITTEEISRPTQQVLVDSVKNVIYLAGIVLEVNEGSINFDEKIINKFTEQDIEDIQEIILDMELLEVVKEFAAEYGYNYLSNEGLTEGYENLLTVSNLKEIMITEEIVTILDVVKILINTDIVDYISLNGFPEKEEDIDALLALVEKQNIQDIADILVELEILKYGLPAGLNFALKMDEVDKLLTEYEIEAEIVRTDEQVLVDTIKSAMYLFSVVFEVNDNSLKFDEKIIGKVIESDINEIQAIIADMEILETVKNVGAEFGYNFLVKQDLIEEYYENILTVENFKQIMLVDEINTILDIVKVIVGTDLQDYIALNGLPKTNEDIDELLLLVEKQSLQDIADILTDLEVLKYALPAGVTFALRMEEVNKILADFEVDLETVGRPTQAALLSTVKEGIYLFSIVFEANENSLKFDEKVIGKINVEDLEDIQDIVLRLEILDFIRDIGAEIGYNYLSKEDLIDGYDNILTSNNFKTISLRNDLITLIDIIILLKGTDLVDELMDTGMPKDQAGFEGLLAKLTKDDYQDIADILVDLELLEYGLPAGVNFALKMDAVKKILNDYEVDTNDVERPTQLVLTNTIKEGIYLFSIVFEANEYSLKFDEKLIGKITVPELEEIKDVILRLEILEFVKELGAEVGYNFLVKEDLREGYEDLLTVDNINAISLKEDIATLIEVIILLKGTDLVDEIMDNGLPKDNAGYEALLAKLTKEQIQNIADELVALKLLELGLPAGLNFALKMNEVNKILTDYEVDKENLNRPSELVLVDGLKDILYLFSIVFTANEGSLNINEKLIGKITVPELEEVKLIILGMELLEFFKEIGSEVGYNYISKQNLNEGYETLLTVDNFNTILLKEELAILIDIVILLKDTDVVDEIMDNGLPKNMPGYETLVSKLTKAEQQLLIDHIVDLKTLYFGLPAGYNFALNMNEVKKLITDYGIDQSTLRRPNQDELKDGVKGFGYIFTVLLEANEGKFNITLDILKKITEEQITEIQVEIAQIELLEIIKEVGSEFAHGFLTKEDLLTDYEDELSVDSLNQIELREELITILEALKVYITVDPNDDVMKNPLVLSKDQVDDMITILAELELVQLGYLVGVNFGLKMNEVKKIFTDANVDINDFVKPVKAQAKDDFLNISVLYGIIKDMNFNHINDFTKINEAFVKAILDNDVERLVHALFDLSIVYENDELLGEISYSLGDKNLPADYKGILKRDTLINNFNAGELTHVALLGKLLFEEGLLKDGANIKISESLTDPNIEKISSNISESIILSEITGDLIGILTKQVPGGFTIEIPVGVTFYGNPGKLELNALLRSVRNLDEYGILGDGFDFGSLTHEQMDEISTNFSNSLIIRHNLSPMMNQMTATTEFSFITSNEDESFWTKAEIYNTLNAVKIFKENDLSAENIHTLPEADVRTISYSITVANALHDYLVKENGPGGSLEDKLVIPGGLTYYSIEGGQDGEMVYLFVGLKEILGQQELSNFQMDIPLLLEADTDLTFRSKIIEATMVEKHLKEMATDGHLSTYIVESYENGDEFDWYIGVNPNNPGGDAVPFIKSVKALEDHGISYSTMDFDTLENLLRNSPACTQCINNALISSKIFNASLPRMLHQMLNEEAGLDVVVKPEYNKGDLAYWGEEGINKELYDILEGITAAEDLSEYDYDLLDNSNKDDFKAKAKLIAKSDTLRQMLPRVIDDSGLTVLDALRSDKDAKDLTEQEWNDEIEVLVDIIVILNENPGFDIDDPDPINDMPILLALYGLMSNSLLYDETKLGI